MASHHSRAQLDSSGRKGKLCPSFLSFHSSALFGATYTPTMPIRQVKGEAEDWSLKSGRNKLWMEGNKSIRLCRPVLSRNHSWGGVLILKLRCHFKGIRIGNRIGNQPLPALLWKSRKEQHGWLGSEFVIVSAVFNKRPLATLNTLLSSWVDWMDSGSTSSRRRSWGKLDTCWNSSDTSTRDRERR